MLPAAGGIPGTSGGGSRIFAAPTCRFPTPISSTSTAPLEQHAIAQPSSGSYTVQPMTGPLPGTLLELARRGAKTLRTLPSATATSCSVLFATWRSSIRSAWPSCRSRDDSTM